MKVTESRGFSFQQFLSFVLLFHCICVARGWWRGVLYWLNVDFVTDALEIPTPNIIRWLITKYSHTININTSAESLWNRGFILMFSIDWSCTQSKSTSDSPFASMKRLFHLAPIISCIIHRSPLNGLHLFYYKLNCEMFPLHASDTQKI